MAFLGLGRMGRPMAANVARAGFPLAVYNRTIVVAQELVQDLSGLSARVASSPAEAAREADVVISMLADGRAVRDVYGGPDGVLGVLRPGTVVVEMSTIGPDEVLALAARVQAAGGALVDAPVSGSVSLSEEGSLTIMAGGRSEDIARVHRILSAMGAVIQVGPSGSGATMKLVVNAVVYGLNQAISEALVLAEEAGLDRVATYGVFTRSAVAAPFVHYRREAFEQPGSVPPYFRLDLAAKDLHLILDLARKVGARMPQSEKNLAVMEDAVETGHGRDDVSAVAQHLRAKNRAPPGSGRPAVDHQAGDARERVIPDQGGEW